MSLTYTDLTETQFPDKIDELKRMSDLSTADLPLVNQYYAYYNAGNIVAAAQLLATNPTLLDKLFNAAKFNVLHDALIALERFYMSDVQTYINSVRDSLQEEVDQLTTYGDYDPSVTYQKYNFIIYEGSVYVAQKNGLKGVVPTIGKSDDNWGLISIKGEQGVSGTGLSWRGAYSLTTQYYKDDCVSDGECIWVANKDSIGQPLVEGEYWMIAITLDEGTLQRRHAAVTVSLPADSWSENRQTVSVSGVTPTNTVFVMASASSLAVYSDAEVECVAQGDGTLTFACATMPRTALSVNIIIFDN